DTIWEVSDDLWARIEPILREDWQPSPKGGQPPRDWRTMFNGIIHRLRSGCQWNRLPKEFGSDRTIHRWFQRWCHNGVMERIWAWTRAMTTQPGGRRRPRGVTRRTAAVSARRTSHATGRRVTSRGGGWWSGPWVGSVNAGHCWCVMTNIGRTTSGCCSWLAA